MAVVDAFPSYRRRDTHRLREVIPDGSSYRPACHSRRWRRRSRRWSLGRRCRPGPARPARPRPVRRPPGRRRQRPPVAGRLHRPGDRAFRAARRRHLVHLAPGTRRRRLLPGRRRLDLRLQLGGAARRRRLGGAVRRRRRDRRRVPDPRRHERQLRRWPDPVGDVAVLRGGAAGPGLRDLAGGRPVRRGADPDGPLQARGGGLRPGAAGGLPDRGRGGRLLLPVRPGHLGRPAHRPGAGALRPGRPGDRAGDLAGPAGPRRVPGAHPLPGGRGADVRRRRGLLVRRRHLLVHHQGRQPGVGVRRGEPAARPRVRRLAGAGRCRAADRRRQHHRHRGRRPLRGRGRRQHGDQRDHAGRCGDPVPAAARAVRVGADRAAFSPDGSRLYFSSQRGTSGARAGTGGITYEVRGPFRR